MRNTLISIFDNVKDPRKIDKCLYELGDLLAVAFLTYISNLEDYSDMAIFAATRARDFGLFPYTDRSSPSPMDFSIASIDDMSREGVSRSAPLSASFMAASVVALGS